MSESKQTKDQAGPRRRWGGVRLAVTASLLAVLPAGPALGFVLNPNTGAAGDFDEPQTWIGGAGGASGPEVQWNSSNAFTRNINDNITDTFRAAPTFTSYAPFPGTGPRSDASANSLVDQPSSGQGRQRVYGIWFQSDQNPPSPASSTFTIRGNPILLGEGGINNFAGNNHQILTDLELRADATIFGGSFISLGDNDNPITIDTRPDSTHELTFEQRVFLHGSITGDGNVVFGSTPGTLGTAASGEGSIYGNVFLYNESDYTGQTILRGGQVVIHNGNSLGQNDTILVQPGGSSGGTPFPNTISALDQALTLDQNFDLQGDISFGGRSDQGVQPGETPFELTLAGDFLLDGGDRTITSEQDTPVVITGDINAQSNQLSFYNFGGSNLRIQGVLRGTDGLIKDGPGTLVLAGSTQNITGSIQTRDGILIIADPNAIAGFSSLDITGRTFLGSENAFNTDIDINLDDNLRLVGDSALTFTGDLVVDNGSGGNHQLTVQTSEQATFTDEASITLNENLDVLGPGSLLLQSELAGSGDLTMDMSPAGELILDADNTGYTGQVVLAGGTLFLADDDALGDNGTVRVNGTSSIAAQDAPRTVDKDFDLNGNLTFADGQALTFNGDFTALTSLQITASNTADTEIAGTLDLGSSNVTLTGDQNLLLSGPITSSGGSKIIKSGENLLTLTAQSTGFTSGFEVNGGEVDLQDGASIAAATTVSGGRFNLNGTIDNDVVSRIDGLLIGNGTIGDSLAIRNGGQVNPGNSIGTLTVNGTGPNALDLQTGGIYVIEFDKTTSGNGTLSNDRIDVPNGGAHVRADTGFRLVQRDDTSVLPGESLTVITTGTGVTVDDPDRVNFEYSGPTFFQFAIDEDALASNPNELSLVATDLPVAEAVPTQYGATPLSTVRNVQNFHRSLDDHVRWRRRHNRLADQRAGLEADTGSFNNSPQFASLDDSQMLAYVDEDTVADNPDAPADSAPGLGARWSVFAEALGNLESFDSEDNRPEFDADTYGVQVGADFRLNSNFTVGLITGFSYTNLDFDDGSDGTVNNFRVGPYFTFTADDFYVDTAVSYGYHDGEIDREINIGSFSQTATGEYDAHDLSLHSNAGFDWVVSPYATVDYTYYRREGFTESGAGPGNLDVDSEDFNALEGGIGVRYEDTWRLGEVRLTPNIYLGYSYEFLDDDDDVTASFAAGGSSFTTTSEGFGEGSVRYGAGIGGLFTEQISAYLQYAGRTSSGSNANSIKAGLTFSF